MRRSSGPVRAAPRFGRRAGVVLAALALPGSAAAEPYLAVRTGLRCAQCHVNRSGGGGRNGFGSVYAQTVLPMRVLEFRERSLNDLIAVGGDFRMVGSGTFRRSTPRTSMDLTEANVYLEARLIRRLLTLYLDETLGPGSATVREAFALVERLPLDGYAKAGKFLLPFGMRLPDDGEYIRERTGFSYRTPDQGVEVGIEPGPLSAVVALTNGSGTAEDNDGKQITSMAAVTFRRFRVGASASRNHDPARRRDVVGGFAGLTAGRLTLLGEVDRIADKFPTGGDLEQVAAYVEGSVLAARGVTLRVTHGYFDPRLGVAQNQRVRSRLGVELFPVAFLQLSAYYLRLQDIPQATTDIDRVIIEAHLHF